MMIDTFIVLLVSSQPTIECPILSEKDFIIFERLEDTYCRLQEQVKEAIYTLPSFYLMVYCSMDNISSANKIVLIEGEDVQSHLQTNFKFESNKKHWILSYRTL